MGKTRGELAVTEPHPAAFAAQDYIASLTAHPGKISIWSESFASCAIEGNRLAEVCSETLNRLLTGQPVSDRYILGLAFTILQGELKSSGSDTTEKLKDITKLIESNQNQPDIEQA